MGKTTDILLVRVREHGMLTRSEKVKLIVLLSIPSILAQITSTLLFYIDASMVGSLGAEASASIGLVETTTWLIGSLTSAASMGFSVQVAHRIGANDFVGARAVLRQALLAVLAFSLMMTAVCAAISPLLPHWLGGGDDICHLSSMYFLIFILSIPFYQIYNLSASMLKCAGNMRLPSIMSVMMCGLDAMFNFLFIFPTREVAVPFTFLNDLGLAEIVVPGMGLGVAGAALGTSTAIVLSSAVMAWAALWKSRMLNLWQDFSSETPATDSDGNVVEKRWVPTRAVIHRAATISLPMAAQYAMMNGAQIVSTLIIAPLGNIAIAAHSLAITAESLCYMPGHGVGEAATTLVGQSLGAGERGLCRVFARLAVGVGMVVMVAMGVVMYVFAPEMIGVMSPVEAIRTLGTDILRIEAWAEPMFAASIVCYACFVGAGDTLKPAVINLSTMWGVRLTLAAALAPTYGLRGVWVAMAVELTLRGLLMLYRLFYGNWMRKVDKHQE